MSEEEGRTESDEARDRNARERMSDGFQKGLGVLSAFKEALEQTISEARERGDLSVDRAREAMKAAAERARDATSDAKERFDFVPAADFEALERRVRALETQLGLGTDEPAQGSGGDAGG